MTEEVGFKDLRSPNFVWRTLFLICTGIGLLLSILQIFHIHSLIKNGYLYWLMALFLPWMFVLFPATKKSSRNQVAWYDVIFFIIIFGTCSFLAYNAWNITLKGWAFQAPLPITIASFLVVLLVLEGVRRTGGIVLFIVASIFGAYPFFAKYMPSFLEGSSYPFWPVVRYHVMSTASVIGIPTQVFGELIIGFLVFGAALVATGGGQFFINIAFAILGTHRGGPAKVAILASSLFGSLTGSVVSNVISTGSVTIPTMRRCGYPPHYAAAVEACSSTGGCIMPPIMGSVAFVMAAFLNIPYYQVAVAAFLPAFLYYEALFFQVDAFAAKKGLSGLKKSEIPSVLPALKHGWPYPLTLFILIYMIYEGKEAQAPFFATAILIALCMMRKETRLNIKNFLNLVRDIGKILIEMASLMAACGLVLGGLSMTGVGTSFAGEFVDAAGSQPILILIFGAAASYILGMGMTAIACYIFLAITLAPGIIGAGFNVLAIHLFVIYWGITSFITPPVALGTYAAAGIAGASPMKAGYTAMRLAIILYFVPFIFVYSPALLLQGSPIETLYTFFSASIGIILIAGGLEGYLVGFGKLPVLTRLLSFASGSLLSLPGWQTDIMGIIIAAIALVIHYATHQNYKQKGLANIKETMGRNLEDAVIDANREVE